MTKKNAKSLVRGKEVINSQTGEVARVTWLGKTNSVIFVEVMDINGIFGMWPHRVVEKL